MKRIVPVFVLFSALTGCASLPTPSVGTTQEIDFARVAAINRAALAAGVQVIWVNAPRKPVQATGG